MNLRQGGAGGQWDAHWLTCALLACVTTAGCQATFAQARGGTGTPPSISVAEYRAHLEYLDDLVSACRKQRDTTACNPAEVGADSRVQWTAKGSSITRDIHYGWLRELLERAGKKEALAASNSNPPKDSSPAQEQKQPPETVDKLLTQAHQRLSDDWKQASVAAENGPSYDSERRSLRTILAGKQYQGVSDTSARERFLEWLGNVLDLALSKLAQFGSRTPWIAFAFRALLVGGCCLGLVWALIRMERQSRIRLEAELIAVRGAPSAREWQLWLADAHTMAEQSLWREAIHYLYWAAVARLESRGSWPADRARTPREYLNLMPATDARKAGLVTLTRSFERTWYGGREAGLSDYQAALKLAAELGVE